MDCTKCYEESNGFCLRYKRSCLEVEPYCLEEDAPSSYYTPCSLPIDTKEKFIIVIGHCDDVPGQWSAHCLNVDVMSQGNSPAHAAQMIGEALELSIEDDANAGRNFLDRKNDFVILYELRKIIDYLNK